jgi:Rrf2 family protein
VKIATRARYALRLMIDIASNSMAGGTVKLREVARRQQISKRYLEQLVITQRNADLVSGLSGRGGGYSLTRPREDIRVREIIAASIGAINVVGCVEHPETCPRSADCASRAMWVRVNEKINEVFNDVTLADLCEDADTVAICHGSGGPPPCSRQEGETA